MKTYMCSNEKERGGKQFVHGQFICFMKNIYVKADFPYDSKDRQQDNRQPDNRQQGIQEDKQDRTHILSLMEKGASSLRSLSSELLENKHDDDNDDA